ncbi:hypothetical protein [Geothrix sp. 21YS21S-2]|uniref:hypothetical protein n=1 Tax=Geothrix sp. 21YS21S-2 TaxID=3068893 RepID=UPI0027B9A1EB|nr:hypothetical protein [Geothrix sp. 21YS21S-2]
MTLTRFPLGALSLALVSLIGCGGTRNLPAPTLGNMGGIYSGKDAAGRLHYALIKAGDGTFSWLATDRSLVYGTFDLNGSMVEGQAFAFAPGAPDVQGAPNRLTLGGGASAGAISLTATDGAGAAMSAAFNLEPDSNGTTALKDLAGTYTASAQDASNGTGATVHIGENGTLSGGDAALGSLSGTVTQPVAGTNGFNVAFTYTPYDAADGSAMTFTGVAFRLKGARTGLALMTQSGVSQFSGIFASVPDPTAARTGAR